MSSPDPTLTDLLLEATSCVALYLDDSDRVLHISSSRLLDQWLEREQPVEDHAAMAVLLQGLFTASQLAQVSGAELPACPRRVAAKPSRRSSPRWFDLTRVQMDPGAGCTSLLLIIDRTTEQNLVSSLAEAQVANELAHAVLRTEPAVLRRFLQNATSSLGFIRTTLRQPSRTQEALCNKLRLLRGEAGSLGTSAAVLALHPVERPAQDMVAALDALLGLAEVSGDDMLPLALHIDAMSIAVTTLSELDEQRATPASTSVGRVAMREAPAWSEVCEQRVNELMARVGAESGVLARLRMKGSANVPEPYQRRIDACIEALVDNALRHGIETPEERVRAGKPATGTITVAFTDPGPGGFEMTVHDDGRGFDLDRIREGVGAAGQGLEPRELVSLVFRSDFSAATAGQMRTGHSMALLREVLRRQGGNVSVATKPERYTQFHVRFAPASHLQRPPARRIAALTR